MGWTGALRYTSVEIQLTPSRRRLKRPGGGASPWYVPPALGGNRRHGRYSRRRIAGPGSPSRRWRLAFSACGGASSDGQTEPAGTYRVKVVRADFPTEQRLGQTSLLRIGVRNTGRKTVPAVTVSVSIAGKAGQTSSLPFAVHDPQPELAQPDRPVWVLSENYPKIDGSPKPGGAGTSSPKTFDLGALKPGRSVEGVWKLSAVKAGQYGLLYQVDAGLSGETKATTAAGVRPGGSFAVRIAAENPDTEVNGKGEIVEIGKPKQASK